MKIFNRLALSHYHPFYFARRGYTASMESARFRPVWLYRFDGIRVLLPGGLYRFDGIVHFCPAGLYRFDGIRALSPGGGFTLLEIRALLSGAALAL